VAALPQPDEAPTKSEYPTITASHPQVLPRLDEFTNFLQCEHAFLEARFRGIARGGRRNSKHEFQGQLNRTWASDLVERTESSRAGIPAAQALPKHLGR
jgi:hypothetical protein